MKIGDFATIIAVIAGVMGLLLLFAPGVLRKFNEYSKKMVAQIDTITFSYRIGFGVSLIIASLFMFFMAYYFNIKGR